jgi:hypothetical protein
MALIIAKAWGDCKDEEVEKEQSMRTFLSTGEGVIFAEDAVNVRNYVGAWVWSEVRSRDTTVRFRSKNILQKTPLCDKVSVKSRVCVIFIRESSGG